MKLTPRDVEHLRAEAAQMRAEADEDESPMGIVMTSVGYVTLWAGYEEGDAEVVINGIAYPESEWEKEESGDDP